MRYPGSELRDTPDIRKKAGEITMFLSATIIRTIVVLASAKSCSM